MKFRNRVAASSALIAAIVFFQNCAGQGSSAEQPAPAIAAESSAREPAATNTTQPSSGTVPTSNSDPVANQQSRDGGGSSQCSYTDKIVIHCSDEDPQTGNCNCPEGYSPFSEIGDVHDFPSAEQYCFLKKLPPADCGPADFADAWTNDGAH